VDENVRCLKPKKAFKLTAYLFYAGIRFFLGIFTGSENWFLGLVCIGISFLLFLTVGGFKAEIVPPFEDTKRYRECLLGMTNDLEVILQREKKNKEQYYQEQNTIRKTMWEGLAIFFVGIVINLISSGIDRFVFPSVLPILPIGHLAGYYVEGLGLFWVFGAYVNSRMPFAREISEKFALRTTSVKIEECSKMIAVTQNKLREQEEKQKKLELEYHSQIKGEGERGNFKNGEFV
jgi:hypothetical protein